MGLTKRKDGYYVEFRVLDNGKTLSLGPQGIGKLKRWKVGSLDKREAKKQEAVIKTRLLTGEIQSPAIAECRAITFDDLIAAYTDDPDVKREDNYRVKKSVLEHVCLPFFKGRILVDITPSDVKALLEKRRTEPGLRGKPITEATVNRTLTYLQAALSWAVKEKGWLTVSPASGIPQTKEHNARDFIVEPDEFRLIYQAIADPLYRLAIKIGYYTALREGNIIRLTEANFDFKAEFITIPGSWVKNDRNLNIPLCLLPDDVIQEIRDIFRVRSLHGNRVIFPFTAKQLYDRFKKAVRAVGSPHLWFHDLRHTGVTNLRRAGVDLLTIKKISGHKSFESFERYNSWKQHDLRQAGHQLKNYLAVTTPSVSNTVITQAS